MPESICAYYSHGPHFLRVLRRLRAQFPEAQITAVVPPAFPEPPIAAYVDAIVHTAQPGYRLNEPRPLLRLLHQLRAPQYTHFVTLFDSTRLRLIARASGARTRVCHTPDGRVLDLRRNLILQAFQVLLRNLRGRMVCSRIRRVVTRHPVGQVNQCP